MVENVKNGPITKKQVLPSKTFKDFWHKIAVLQEINFAVIHLTRT